MDNKLFNRQDYCDCRMAEAEGGVVGSCFFHVSAPRNHLFATPRHPEHNYNLKLVSFLIWTTWTSNSNPFTCVQQDNGNSGQSYFTSGLNSSAGISKFIKIKNALAIPGFISRQLHLYLGKQEYFLYIFISQPIQIISLDLSENRYLSPSNV